MQTNALNYFIGTPNKPFHLSVGAVVLNEKQEVLSHYFPSITVDKKTAHDLYILIRETLEPQESLEDAVHRGLIEETGTQASIESYIGSIVSEFKRGNEVIEKTTLYFLCHLLKFNPSKRDKQDPESGSEILFLPIDELIKRSQKQALRYQRSDLDESNILEQVKKLKNLA